MRRVNVRNGLKQRVNEILGTDFGTEGDVPGLTLWSIQAAAITNLRRIVSAIAADSVSGRPMKGLWMTPAGGALVNISVGYGFTKNGDIIVLEAPLSYTANVATDDTWHMYLKHSMAELDGAVYDDGKKTNFIGKPGLENIVYDDKAASKKDSVQLIVADLVEQSAFVTDNPDWVYLGTITTLSGTVTVVTYSDRRGFGVDPDDWYRVPNIRTSGNTYVGGNLTVEGQILTDIIKAESGSIVDFQDDVQFSNPAAFGDTATFSGTAGKIVVGATPGHSGLIDTAATPKLTVVNGLITGASA